MKEIDPYRERQEKEYKLDEKGSNFYSFLFLVKESKKVSNLIWAYLDKKVKIFII